MSDYMLWVRVRPISWPLHTLQLVLLFHTIESRWRRAWIWNTRNRDVVIRFSLWRTSPLTDTHSTLFIVYADAATCTVFLWSVFVLFVICFRFDWTKIDWNWSVFNLIWMMLLGWWRRKVIEIINLFNPNKKYLINIKSTIYF